MEANRLKQQTPKICSQPWSNLLVTISGDVYPCCYNTSRSFGNIKSRTIRDIWNGDEFIALRKAWMSGDIKGTGCENCRLLKITNGNIPYDSREIPDNDKELSKNARQNQREFDARATVLSAMPMHLTYFPSTHCNLSCIFCGQNNCEVLDLGEAGYSMVAEITPYLRSITWLGGEPILQPQLKRWLTHFESFENTDITVCIITNASFFGEQLMAMAEMFAGLSINISFDAHQPELYEALRRKGKFEQTLANIDRYRLLRQMLPHLSVNLNMLWQKMNFALLPDYLRFCRERELYALINPLDHWPVPMRLDVFEDLQQDLPEDHEAILEAVLDAAGELDAALAGKPHMQLTLPCARLSVDLVRKGIARFRSLDAVYAANLSPDRPGRLVIASDANGEVLSYGHVAQDGGFRLRHRKAEPVLVALYKDDYGNPGGASLDDLIVLSRSKTIAIWGVGNFYHGTLSQGVRDGGLGASLRYLIDSSAQKQGSLCDGYRISDPRTLLAHPVGVVAVASSAFLEILECIRSLRLAEPVFVMKFDGC